MFASLVALVFRYPRQAAGLALVVGALGTYAALRHRIHALEADRHRLGLEALTLTARLDTTRTLGAEAAAALRAQYGDSMRGVRRLVEQGTIARDALTRALHESRAVAVRLSLRLDSLRGPVAGAGVTADSFDLVRRDSFPVVQPPFRGFAVAELPRPPARGSLRLGISVDELEQELDLGCAERRDPMTGLYPATATVVAPSWARVRIAAVRAEGRVCNPRQLETGGFKLPWWAALVAAGAGIVLGRAVP